MKNLNFTYFSLILFIIGVPFITITIIDIGILVYLNLILLLAFLFDFLVSKQSFKISLPLLLYISVYLLFSILSIHKSEINIFGEQIRIILLVIIFKLLNIRGKDIHKVKTFYLIYMTIIAFFSLFNSYRDLENRLWINFFGVLQDPNYFTIYYFLAFYIAIHYLKNSKLLIKTLSFISISIILIFILSSGSRGTLLSLFISLILFMLLLKKDKSISFIFIIFAFIIVFGISIFLPPELYDRFSIERIIESGGAGRIDIWVFYINQISEWSISKIIFGNGLGTIYSNLNVPHNQFLTLLYENGIFGFFIFYLFFCNELYNSKNNYLLFVNLAILFTTFFLTVTTNRYYWISVLLTNALVSKDNIENQSESFNY